MLLQRLLARELSLRIGEGDLGLEAVGVREIIRGLDLIELGEQHLLVELREQLALLHAIVEVRVELDHATRDLRPDLRRAAR